MADDSKPPEARPDDDAWIERVVNVAGNLGFNKMRLRWKLIRWQEGRRRKARQRAQVMAHITYAHKTCHECGSVQDKDEAVCTRCGAKLGRRGFQVLQRIGLATPVPLSMSTLIAVALLAAYGKVWIANGGGLASPSGSLLIEFGGRWAPAMADEPWRLVTSMFLHANPLHLAFNILAIATVGPRIEELYGRPTMLGLFIATGVVANIASLAVAGHGVGIGASGGLMGLTGVAAACGHRMGTSYGRAVRDAMLKWMGYTFVYGFMLHADNWAHLFGALAGGAFGLAVLPKLWLRRVLIPVRALLGAIGLVATFGAVMIIFTRTPTPPEELHRRTADDGLDVFAGYVDACKKLYAGDAKGAVAVASHVVVDDRRIAVTEATVAAVCAQMQKSRNSCRTGAPPDDDSYADPDPARQRALCAVFDRLPPDPRAAPEATGRDR